MNRRHVFVLMHEIIQDMDGVTDNDKDNIYWILVSDNLAELVLRDREAFCREYTDGPAKVLDLWEVPMDLENNIGTGGLNDALDALLGLDRLGETPIVSDLLSTLFDIAFQLGKKSKECCRKSGCSGGRVVLPGPHTEPVPVQILPSTLTPEGETQ